MDDLIFVDFETASLADIRQVGAWPYSRDPSTHVYCMVTLSAANDRYFVWQPDEHHPQDAHDIEGWLADGGKLVAHNVSFERSIWENLMVPRYGFPEVPHDRWLCTQAMGLALNLPMTLEGLARALGCEVQKDLEGGKLMKEMAKAVEKRGAHYTYPLATPENLKRLISYCRDDVIATAQCYERMGRLTPAERRTWFADQAANHRGVYLDRDFARRCLLFTRDRMHHLDSEVFKLTFGELGNASASPTMKKWIKEQGVKLPKLARAGGPPTETLNETGVLKILETDPPKKVRSLLELRQEGARATSLAKLQRVAEVTDVRDGRLRHALQFCGAHTGRWASYGLQLHNLPKNRLDPVDFRLARRCVESGDLELFTFLFDKPLDVLSQLLRSVIAAPPGKELIAGDYSAIEARVVAWLANQGDVVQLFQDYDDGHGEDVYTAVARGIGSDNRQLGKVCQLMLGFGAGPVRFTSTAAEWGVPLDLKQSKDTVALWRKRNGAIAMLWETLEEAAHNAVRNPGDTFKAGKLICKATKHCLSMRLPSGRVLRYWRPSLAVVTKKVQTITDEGEIKTIEFQSTELRFFQMAKNKTDMVPTSTYGGKLVENATQATARDLLAAALPRLELTPPYEVVMHVHDSLACEVPEDEGDVDEFCELMGRRPAWASDLPVAVDGYRSSYFQG